MRNVLLTVLFAAVALATGCSDHDLPTAPGQVPRAQSSSNGPPAGQAAQIEGLVFAPGSGEMIAGARVQIGGAVMTTGSDGRFLHEATSGPSSIRVAGAATLAAGGDLWILPGAQNLYVPMVVEGTTDGYVFGRVADASSGAPIAGASVGLFGTTAADGTFWSSACCNTIGAVTVSAAGYETSTVYLGRFYDHSGALDVLLQPIQGGTR